MFSAPVPDTALNYSYLIVDQFNAFDLEENSRDAFTTDEKAEVRRWLAALMYGHYEITSASANRKQAIYLEKKQENDIKISVYGGLTEI